MAYMVLLLFPGCVAACGHPDDINNPQSRDNEESPYRRYAQRTPNVVSAYKGSERVGQGMVHVSNKHRPNEESGNSVRVSSWDLLIEDAVKISQVGYLQVVVPPDILDYPTSTDMVVREGSNVTLRCAANGTPEPSITWRRENGDAIPVGNGVEG